MGESFAYEKGGVYPKPVVKFGERVLKEKTDYTLSYRNNGKVNDGSDESKMPTVFINSKGNFEGTVAKTFTITKGNLSEQIITAEDKATGDKGGVFKSTPVITSKTGQKLQAGKDYDESKTAYYYKEETTLKDGTVRDAGALVEDADIIPAGTAIRVVSVGKGNFEGTTLAGEYRVVKYDLSKAHIEIPKKDYTGEEVVLNKDEIVITLDGQTLTADDFEIVGYENNTNRGKAKVTIKGVGDYGGTRTVKFTIKSKLLEWWEDVLEMLFG